MSNKERIARIEARMSELERLSLFQPAAWATPPPLHDPAEMLVPSNTKKALKPIDWSKVACCVPVKLWDDEEASNPIILYPNQSASSYARVAWWDHRSLITGIDIAWHGGECPLPNGVVVEVTTRKGDVYETADARVVSWQAPATGPCTPFDIISFRVTGIHPDWTEEVGE